MDEKFPEDWAWRMCTCELGTEHHSPRPVSFHNCTFIGQRQEKRWKMRWLLKDIRKGRERAEKTCLKSPFLGCKVHFESGRFSEASPRTKQGAEQQIPWLRIFLPCSCVWDVLHPRRLRQENPHNVIRLAKRCQIMTISLFVPSQELERYDLAFGNYFEQIMK